MRKSFRTGIASLLFVGVSSVHAQENNIPAINITTTAVPFLRISPDARTGGMGDAGIALSTDVNSVFYNQAKIPFAKSKQGIGVNYTPWLKEIADNMYLATLAGFYQLDENQALTASLRYFNPGDITMVDYNGNKLQTAHPREFALDAGYTRKLSGKISLGTAMRYISSRLGTGTINNINYIAGNAVAGDLSVYYNGINDNHRGFTAGISLSNLGMKIGYTDDADNKDFLPANCGIGVAYTETWDEDNAITFGLQADKLLVPAMPATAEGISAYRRKTVASGWFDSFDNNAMQIGLGAEYGFKELLFLRLGINSKSYSYGNWQYVTAGCGVRYNIMIINFAYLVSTGEKINRNPLSNTIRLGLVFEWNK